MDIQLPAAIHAHLFLIEPDVIFRRLGQKTAQFRRVFRGLGKICDNPGDEDADGFADCADPECAQASSCIAEICNDGIDNDHDDDRDCADDECAGHPDCTPEICDDGKKWHGYDSRRPRMPNQNRLKATKSEIL